MKVIIERDFEYGQSQNKKILNRRSNSGASE